MPFLRVVEVFQPLFPSEGGDDFHIRAGLDRFVAGVKDIRDLCDVVLVGDHKSPGLLKFSSVESAALLERETGVTAAPVVVARDSNRAGVRSAILTAYGLGLRNLMVAWGDRYPVGGPKNVYDFAGLSSMIAETKKIAEQSGASVRLFAPVNIASLAEPGGVKAAKARLSAGADLLLAQPPTTDSGETFDEHLRLLEESGLEGKVLLCVFPFRNREDVDACERSFGWTLPQELRDLAESGEGPLLDESRKVATRVRDSGLLGVYVSTRGTPAVARAILG